MDPADERELLVKVSRRLLPFLFVLYVVNILDRVNVSFASLTMLPELGMDKAVYGVGFGLFYIGYLMFEVPSNLILHKVGARRWIGRIMISWGLITCAMAAIEGVWGFYLLRILLGFAEAGFFPGIILYLSYWFPARERARMVALFMAASPITGVLGNPLSGAIMEGLDGWADLSGWRWVFLLEGIPAIVLGVAVLVWLTDRPRQASWLTAAERDWLAQRMEAEDRERHERHGLTLWRALADRRVWLLIALYFTVAAGSNAFGAYLPQLVEDRFPDLNKFGVGLVAAIPNLVAVIAMVFNGVHSDRTGERTWHVAVPAFVAAGGWALSAMDKWPVVSLLGLCLAQAGIMSMLPTFWTLPAAFLSGVAAAGGIALINSVGNLGGFVGPTVVGSLEKATGDYGWGLVAMAFTMFVGGLLAMRFRPGNADGEHRTSADDTSIPGKDWQR
jgi:ACS family tartrate transporter-like MFS transporter